MKDIKTLQEEKKVSIHSKEYKRTRPWVKHFISSKYRSKRLNRQHTLSVEDFEKLWIRDSGHKLARPSIDRIDNDKGYIGGNCRFIELSENSRLGELVTKHSRGEGIKQSKLKKEQILEIRRLNKLGVNTIKLSELYDISQQSIWDLVNFKTWKHIK